MLFVLATPEAITVHVPGVGPRKIFADSPVYGEVRDLLLSPASEKPEENLTDGEKLERFLRLVDRAKRIAEGSEGKLVLVDGRFQMDGEFLPALFTKRLIELEGTSIITSLSNLWKNLRNNPTERSRTELLDFLEKNEMPITEDGHFIAYKYVTSDFKDVRTRTFDNSPGAEPTMNREDVDDDSSVTCSRGLHVAAYEYARKYGQTLVAVKVNPVDVVSIPFDYNGQKMRGCRYKVLEAIGEEVKDKLYIEKKEEQPEKAPEESFELTIKEPIDTRLNHLNQPRGNGGRWVKKA